MSDSKFYSNTGCEYYPCHKIEDKEEFNCKFCFCPLYTLGSKCGGNFKYIAGDIKDCSDCIIPHKKNGYDYIISKTAELMKLAKENK